MAYKALTYVNLPPDNRKAPGDPITKKELDEAGQTDEDIESLIKQRAIGKPTDPIDNAHAPVVIRFNTNATDVVNVIDSDVGRSDERNV